ncbi:Gem-associated protein 7 [Manis javanica]|nr:Gem-associated protein 7 [Manis javanica]
MGRRRKWGRQLPRTLIFTELLICQALSGTGDEVVKIMQTPLAIPVPVLRLPRGPDGFSRGFAPDGRRALLKPQVPEILESSIVQESRESQEQQARAALRERYLRSLLAMKHGPHASS